MRMIMMLLAALVIAGCSNKAVYENLQHNQKLRCEQLPLAEYDRCMRGTEKSFEEYEQERREYLEEREKETEH